MFLRAERPFSSRDPAGRGTTPRDASTSRRSISGALGGRFPRSACCSLRHRAPLIHERASFDQCSRSCLFGQPGTRLRLAGNLRSLNPFVVAVDRGAVLSALASRAESAFSACAVHDSSCVSRRPPSSPSAWRAFLFCEPDLWTGATTASTRARTACSWAASWRRCDITACSPAASVRRADPRESWHRWLAWSSSYSEPVFYYGLLLVVAVVVGLVIAWIHGVPESRLLGRWRRWRGSAGSPYASTSGTSSSCVK